MDQPRRRVSSGGPWELLMGYCRAVRVGDQVVVAGTAPQNADGSVDHDVAARRPTGAAPTGARTGSPPVRSRSARARAGGPRRSTSTHRRPDPP